MSDIQVEKYSDRSYFLECPAIFGNRTSKNLGVLVRRTSEHFKIFLPLLIRDRDIHINLFFFVVQI